MTNFDKKSSDFPGLNYKLKYKSKNKIGKNLSLFKDKVENKFKISDLKGKINLKKTAESVKELFIDTKNLLMAGGKGLFDFIKNFNPFHKKEMGPEVLKKEGKMKEFVSWFFSPPKKDDEEQKYDPVETQKNMNEMMKAQESCDPEIIKPAFVKAIARRETGPWKKERRLSLANMHAIAYNIDRKNSKTGKVEKYTNDLGNILKKSNIKPPEFILKGSTSLFKKEHLKTFDTFEDRIKNKLTPEGGNLNQATKILSCCAIGKYQIVPIFHFQKMGWPTEGEAGRKKIYEFIQNEPLQKKLCEKITEKLAKRYDWNTILMAAAYYGGHGGARRVAKGLGKRKEAHGYSSVEEYAYDVHGNTKKNMKDEGMA